MCIEALPLPVPCLTPDFHLCSICIALYSAVHCQFLLDHLILSLMKISLCIIQERWIIENFLALMVQLVITPHHKWHLHLCRSVVFKLKYASDLQAPSAMCDSVDLKGGPGFAFLLSCQVMLELLVQGAHFENPVTDACCLAYLWNPWELELFYLSLFPQDNGIGSPQ